MGSSLTRPVTVSLEDVAFFAEYGVFTREINDNLKDTSDGVLIGICVARYSIGGGGGL